MSTKPGLLHPDPPGRGENSFLLPLTGLQHRELLVRAAALLSWLKLHFVDYSPWYYSLQSSVHPGMDARILVGINLRRYRNIAQMSQEHLADLAGIDRTYVSGVERGIRNPTVTVLQSLADALKIEPAALLAKLNSPLSTKKSSPAPK